MSSELNHDIVRRLLPGEPGSLRQEIVCALPSLSSERAGRLVLQRTLEGLPDLLAWPFNNHLPIHTIWRVSEKLAPYLDRYQWLVGDDRSAILFTALFERLVNNARAAGGLPLAESRFINGKYKGAPDAGTFPDSLLSGQRLLLVTDVIGQGDTIQNLYAMASRHCPADSIDIVALATSSPTSRLMQQITLNPESHLFLPNQGPSYPAMPYFYGVQMRNLLARNKHEGSQHSTPRVIDAAHDAKLTRAFQEAQMVADTLYFLLQQSAT